MGRNSETDAAAGRRTIALGANDAWNLINYRAGLIAALQEAGFRVVAIAPPGPHDSGFRDIGVDFYPLPMSPRGTSPLNDLRVLFEFVRQLRAIKPAVFLGFTSKPNIYGSIAARLCGIPVINNVSGLGTAFNRTGPLQNLVSRLYRLALKRSSTVFFQNRDDLELFEGRRLIRSEQAALLPGSGVDLDHFAPSPMKAERSQFTFLFAARLLWEKGLREFVEAARSIRSRRDDVQFQVLGFIEPAGLLAVPKEQLTSWQSEGVIGYLGSTDDVRTSFANADCVVLPSYYREGVPRVLLEASAMALPVITTDMPGCRDAVDDEVTGLICEARSVGSLERAMERMADMSVERRRVMGLAGRKKMALQFEEGLVHRAYFDALAKLGIVAG